MRFGWDGFFKMAVGVSFLVVIGMAIFLIFSGKDNNKDGKTGEIDRREVNILTPSWNKVMNYQKEHPKLLKTRTLELMFSGEITAVSADSLTIKGNDGDVLLFDRSMMLEKAGVFEVPVKTKASSYAELNKLSYGALTIGDSVSVNVSIVFDTGTERVTSIGRVPK